MHQKTLEIDFFVIFRNLQKKLPICKKKYAKILKSVRAVVTDVENRQNGTSEQKKSSRFCVTDCSILYMYTTPKIKNSLMGQLFFQISTKKKLEKNRFWAFFDAYFAI